MNNTNSAGTSFPYGTTSNTMAQYDPQMVPNSMARYYLPPPYASQSSVKILIIFVVLVIIGVVVFIIIACIYGFNTREMIYGSLNATNNAIAGIHNDIDVIWSKINNNFMILNNAHYELSDRVTALESQY